MTIRHGCEPIAGSLRLADGRTLHFVGYLQLVGLLEKLRKPGLADRPDASDGLRPSP